VDAANPALYLELNEAMRQMGKTPMQRADMMKSFPNPATISPELIRALVDALREAGKNDEANAVLAGHFVPRKEGEQPLQSTNQTK
jgi:hypothetical protein